MPRGVALVRLGNVIGQYKAHQEGHMFTLTQKFPEGNADYQDPWLTKEEPVSYGERRAARKQFDFNRATKENAMVVNEDFFSAPKPKRGRPRKPVI